MPHRCSQHPDPRSGRYLSAIVPLCAEVLRRTHAVGGSFPPLVMRWRDCR